MSVYQAKQAPSTDSMCKHLRSNPSIVDLDPVACCKRFRSIKLHVKSISLRLKQQ